MTRDADQLANLAAELDALNTPTTQDVLAVTQDYDAYLVAAEASKRALGGGGGGGGGGGASVQLLGPFNFTPDFPNTDFGNLKSDEHVVTALADGTVLLEYWTVTRTYWSDPGSASDIRASLDLKRGGSGANIATVTIYDDNFATDYPWALPGMIRHDGTFPWNVPHLPVIAQVSASLTVTWYAMETAVAPSADASVDLYAIVLTP